MTTGELASKSRRSILEPVTTIALSIAIIGAAGGGGGGGKSAFSGEPAAVLPKG